MISMVFGSVKRTKVGRRIHLSDLWIGTHWGEWRTRWLTKTGGVDLLQVEWGDGASKEHYALCRCGASKNKPFCDGTHWAVEFKDDRTDGLVEAE